MIELVICTVHADNGEFSHYEVRDKETGEIVMARLHVGQQVHYQPEHYGDDKWENGIIKEIRPEKVDGVWVVYNCADNWDRYTEYTSALTNLRDLKLKWRLPSPQLAPCNKVPTKEVTE